MAASGNSHSEPKSILVVTDTPEDLHALQEQLGDEGYRLAQTWDTEKALEQVEEDAPDLVLLDITSPEIHGLEFCEKLRSRAGTEAIPVIVIAGQRSAEQEEAVLDIGADGFIYRPFERVELLTRVRTLIRMKELHDKVAEQNRQQLRVNAEMDRVNQELMAHNRGLEEGMEMAHRLQEALLPQKYPRIKNVSFSHKYLPAEAIGGDVFQIIAMDDGRAAIFIADVSGHGVRAALITSIVHTVIDFIDFSDKTPGQVLSDFNSRFRGVLGDLAPQIYATGLVMMVDGENRSLAIAGAGHPFPLLVSKRTGTAEPLLTLDEIGPALGFLNSPEYPTCESKLSVGDIVFSFTDGIYDVANEQEEIYGLSRLQKLVAANSHLVPRDLIQRIITETEEFMGTGIRPDDVCIVTFEMS